MGRGSEGLNPRNSEWIGVGIETGFGDGMTLRLDAEGFRVGMVWV
jgi:hypothetical protein